MTGIIGWDAGGVNIQTEAIAHQVPFRGDSAGVSLEGFAIMGNIHLWLGGLTPEDYTVATPDGRPATGHFIAREAACPVGLATVLGQALASTGS